MTPSPSRSPEAVADQMPHTNSRFPVLVAAVATVFAGLWNIQILAQSPAGPLRIVASPPPAPSTYLTDGSTFFEDFESTPNGELPEGWTYYQRGGTMPDAHWFVTTELFGRRFVYSGAEPGNGEEDEDWLITPVMTPAPGDFLVFDATQGFSEDYGDRFHILVSKTTAVAPDAFTDTLATYTEAEFPLFYHTVKVDLAAYAGVPIFLAFVHESTAEFPDEWRMDNVWVRPLQNAAVLDIFLASQNTSPPTSPIPVGDSTHAIGQVNVRILGDEGTVDVTSLSFTAEGTTNLDHVKEARLYYTGDIPFLAFPDTANVVFDTILHPASEYVFEGRQTLPPGDNFFWLIYTIDPALEPEYPYPQADATFEEAVVDGTVYEASVSTIEGSTDIVGAPAANDSLAQAVELSPEPARYGSHTLFATDQLDLGEPGASCADNGLFDGRNSVWWHFIAPAEGTVTADLSASEFDTILLLLDENLTEIGCNDDIEPGVTTQSRIGDIEVSAGQGLYVRVTGKGLPTMGDIGVVGLDFAFSVSTGTEEPDEPETDLVTRIYPNPADRQATLTLQLGEPSEVVVDLYDLLGRRLATRDAGMVLPGISRIISFDVSGIPAGKYLIRIQYAGKTETQSMMVVH